MNVMGPQGANLPQDPDAPDPVQARLASYCAQFRFADLPDAAVHCARALTVDTLGCAVAGFAEEPCVKLRRMAQAAAGAGQATLLGTRQRTSLELAALVNASTARYIEANDVFARYKPGTAHGHPSDVIAPLLAVAEHVQASGRDFLAAVVLAYEIYLRICDACHSEGFDPASFGCIAIAGAAARLLGLSRDGIAQAIAIAATTHNILKQVRSDRVTVWKALAAGEAGRAGIQACLLAQAGFDGPSRPFVGTAGWCDHVAGKRFLLEEMGDRHHPFLICESRIKTRPVRALVISAVLAAEKLAGRVADLEDVSRIEVATYRRARQGTGPQHWVSASRETADHSIPYCVAAALIDGELGPRAFDDAHLRDPLLRRLMAKLEIVEEEAFTRAYEALPQAHRSRISIFDGRGRCLQAESGGDEDDLATPKSRVWIERKFRTMCGGMLEPQRIGALLAELWMLERSPGVAGIVAALVPE